MRLQWDSSFAAGLVFAVFYCFYRGLGLAQWLCSQPFGERNTKPKLADTKASTFVSALHKTVKTLFVLFVLLILTNAHKSSFICFSSSLLIWFFFLFFCLEGLYYCLSSFYEPGVVQILRTV